MPTIMVFTTDVWPCESPVDANGSDDTLLLTIKFAIAITVHAHLYAVSLKKIDVLGLGYAGMPYVCPCCTLSPNSVVAAAMCLRPDSLLFSALSGHGPGIPFPAFRKARAALFGCCAWLPCEGGKLASRWLAHCLLDLWLLGLATCLGGCGWAELGKQSGLESTLLNLATCCFADQFLWTHH